jgi:formylglycine-generating enzyme required for sulfatase activity
VTNAQYATFVAEKAGDTSGQPAYCSWNTGFAPTDVPPAGSEQLPVIQIDWCDAFAYCLWAGKRLCGAISGGSTPVARFGDPEVSAWYDACSSHGTLAFPYGDTAVPGRCNGTGGPTLVAVGSLAECRGAAPPYASVFDMMGNVSEWEDGCTGATGKDDECRVRGGSRSSNDLRCLRDEVVARSTAKGDLGFRCCGR